VKETSKPPPPTGTGQTETSQTKQVNNQSGTAERTKQKSYRQAKTAVKMEIQEVVKQEINKHARNVKTK